MLRAASVLSVLALLILWAFIVRGRD